MGIKADIQSLSPSALIELFELDMSNTTSGGKLFFHAGTNELMEPVVWQGVSYEPWPIKASGFDKTGQVLCRVQKSRSPTLPELSPLKFRQTTIWWAAASSAR